MIQTEFQKAGAFILPNIQPVLPEAATDERYMQMALGEAQKALDKGEVPIGALIVWDGRDKGKEIEVVSTAHNTRETEKNALHHAELLAIDRACQALGGWRLHKATLYVTLEPCLMCTGAILSSRIARVVYGAPDPKSGGLGGLCDLRKVGYTHTPEVTSGICEEECRGLLNAFFEQLRRSKKAK